MAVAAIVAAWEEFQRRKRKNQSSQNKKVRKKRKQLANAATGSAKDVDCKKCEVGTAVSYSATNAEYNRGIQ